MGAFEKIGNVSRQFSSTWISDGNYIVRVDEVRQGRSNQKGEFWKIEMTILDVIDGKQTAGTFVTRLRTFSKPGSLPEFKAFLMSALGLETEAEVTEQLCEFACSDAQPMAGFVMNVVAHTVPTSAHTPEKPAFFTKVDYTRRIWDKDVATVVTPEGQAIYSKPRELETPQQPQAPVLTAQPGAVVPTVPQAAPVQQVPPAQPVAQPAPQAAPQPVAQPQAPGALPPGWPQQPS